jgi:hypothetical protein
MPRLPGGNQAKLPAASQPNKGGLYCLYAGAHPKFQNLFPQPIASIKQAGRLELLLDSLLDAPLFGPRWPFQHAESDTRFDPDRRGPIDTSFGQGYDVGIGLSLHLARRSNR